jgi:hypothetical protein
LITRKAEAEIGKLEFSAAQVFFQAALIIILPRIAIGCKEQ